MNFLERWMIVLVISMVGATTMYSVETLAQPADSDVAAGITMEVETEVTVTEEDGNKTREVVLGIVSEVLNAIPEEMREEMSEEDRAEFEQALAAIEKGEFDDEGGKKIIINANHAGGDGIDWTGLMAVILLFGGPVAIVALVTWNNRRKREMVHQSIDRIVEHGGNVPTELLDALDKGNGKSALQRGTVNVALGVGLGAALWSISGADVATLALIPFCIGLAQLLVWRMEGGQSGGQ